MTWRAFIIGLISTAALSALEPYTCYNKWYGCNFTENHFPTGCVFLLVFLTLGVNLVVKLVRRRWALRRAELMLVWCMVTVASAAPSPDSWWACSVAGPTYVAARADVMWRETSLEAVPDELLVSKDPKSVAVKQLYEGTEGRLPWGRWLKPLGLWALLIVPFYMAVLFFFAILRKQWVEHERLQFPLARVPLEFSRSAAAGWLPEIFQNRAFLGGIAFTAALRLVRAMPLFFGGEGAWNVQMPFGDVLQGTPLEHLYLYNVTFWWKAWGFAYLVPADVSLSVWLFYLLGRCELQTTAWLGSPLHAGGTWSDLMNWQMTGSYIVFTIAVLFMARRHLASVLKKAVGRGRQVDDSEEPVSYPVAFWGFLICTLAVVAWFAFYGMKLWVAVLVFAAAMCALLVHARMVAQSGLYVTELNMSPTSVLHGLGGGHVFGARGAILSQIFHNMLMFGNTPMLSPPAVNAFRIATVFEKRRKWLVPAMLAALAVATVAAGWSYLAQGYSVGVLNFKSGWGSLNNNTEWVFSAAHQMIERPGQYYPVRWLPFVLGMAVTALVMFMRARFYWWPLHPIGLVSISNWYMDRIWVPFLLGWLIKLALLKFTSGRAVRQARYFFVALILTDFFVDACSTAVGLISRGAVPSFL